MWASANQNRIAVGYFLHHFFEEFVSRQEVFIKETYRIIKLISKCIARILQVWVAPLVVISHVNGFANVAHQHANSLPGAFWKHLVRGVFHIIPPISRTHPSFVALFLNIPCRTFFGPFVVVHHLCCCSCYTASRRCFAINFKRIFVIRKILAPLTSKQWFHLSLDGHLRRWCLLTAIAYSFHHTFIIF